MKYLVASLRAELLPLAHRLRREGHEVEAMVWHPRYEGAWGGSIQKLARHTDGSLMASVLRPQIEAAGAGDLAVLTDVPRVAELFHTARHLYAVDATIEETPAPKDRCLVGGWFDGEEMSCRHLLCADWGAWTGGLGPQILGGLTLVNIVRPLPEVLRGADAQAGERLKSQGFRGLFHYDVEEELESGELRLHGLRAGWPWLHTQAFVAELESLGSPTTGGPPKLRHKFVSVLPVSLPPWPSQKQGKMERGIAVEGLTPQQQGRLFWFDIEVDQQARKLRTAGLDGLLAVATGASDSTPALARARALELATQLQVPEKQYRHDVGSQVDALLSTLEDRWGFVA